jgi:hypothetical protein
MTMLGKMAFASMIGAGALTLSVASASAAIVCNGAGECWHAQGRYAYPREAGVVVHPDNWRWAANDHYRWNEHEGRGYWRGGRWVAF